MWMFLLSVLQISSVSCLGDVNKPSHAQTYRSSQIHLENTLTFSSVIRLLICNVTARTHTDEYWQKVSEATPERVFIIYLTLVSACGHAHRASVLRDLLRPLVSVTLNLAAECFFDNASSKHTPTDTDLPRQSRWQLSQITSECEALLEENSLRRLVLRAGLFKWF